MTAAFCGAGNAGVAMFRKPAAVGKTEFGILPDRSDDPTPELDARIVGEMSAIFFRTFRGGGGAGDADLLGAGFTPAQIDRYGARALADARRRYAAKSGAGGETGPAPHGPDCKSGPAIPSPSRRSGASSRTR